ncbi:cell surface protein [Clostridium botulinum]|uniref:Surface protein PspA n=1 Tax=Clostridium botulinum (strain Eklund 17B / Type B) TaxID=935198 RepID=B2TQG1_CLOBB|nr:surface protein PspA [Clostridium botulinum B str. Eklund 17B (NRP)]MBY6975597.1 cell surface protein [Clostridium botulinum]MBY7001146.1 cell surface protein [Clostridium botulinum]MCR1273912.1 cell surface protein [Clostridium botulinum]NFD69323.1 cell surface protein [Clostridium botulinum]
MREFMRHIHFKPIAMILTILFIQFTFNFYLPCKDSYIAYASEVLHKDDIEKYHELSENLIGKSTELMSRENILSNNENNKDGIILKDFNESHIVKECDNTENTESKDEKIVGDSNNTIDKDDNVSEKPDEGNTGGTEQGGNSGNESSGGNNEDVPPEIDNKKQAIVPSINSFAEDMGKNYEKLTVSAANINVQGEYTFIILASDKLNVCKHSATNSTLNKWFIPLIELSKGEQKLSYSTDGKNFFKFSLDSNNKIPYYMRANITGALNYTEKERDSILYFKYSEDNDDTAIKIRIHYIPSVNANDNSNSGNISGDILKSVYIYGTERVGSTLRAKTKYNNNTDKPKVSYQWLRCKDKDGEYKEISGADKEEYKLKSNDKGYYLKVKITVSGEVSESKESDRSEIIKEKLKENSSSSNSGSSSSNNYHSGIVVDTDKTNDDQMYLNTSYSSKVDKEIFDLTKEYEYKKLILEGSNYVWNFNASDLKNVSQMDDNFDSEIQTKTQTDSEVVINFKHHGVLPGKATIQVNVGDGLNGDNRCLYYYNEGTNSLELISSNVSVKKGKAIFTITHCSKYILSANPNANSNISSGDYNTTIETSTQDNYVNNVVDSDKTFNDPNLNNTDSSSLKWRESMDGKWYLCSNSFIMTGWQKVDNNWYYFNEFGVMQKDWVNSNGKWYYLDNNGCMITGWIKSNNNWYYTNSSGEISTGWKEFNKVWCYFNIKGEMQTGWQYIDYRWYYLYPDGSMAYNVEIDGRVLNNNGAAR